MSTIIYNSVNIYGDYWDSYIHKDNLYLWTMNGSVKILNWKKINDRKHYNDIRDIKEYLICEINNPFVTDIRI